MVGDKIPESIEKLDGELGTWQSGENVLIGDLEGCESDLFTLLLLLSDDGLSPCNEE